MKKNNLSNTKTSSPQDRQKGFAIPIVIAIIALIAIIAGVGYFATKKQPQTNPTHSINSGPSATQTLVGEKKLEGYSGSLLAGKSAPLLDFNKADYDAALKTDKLIVLYFYANWCPICKNETANALYPAFNELSSDKVIGFRVNYKDNQTDNDETNLAKEFGVAYQHTKVFVKNGTRILKSPEGWDKNRYQNEINKALTQ